MDNPLRTPSDAERSSPLPIIIKGGNEMCTRRHAITAAIVLSLGLTTLASAQEAPRSFAITLKADDVHELAELKIEANGLTLTANNVLAVPIRCELGITGAMLLGDGKFAFTPKDGEAIKGQFRAAMLRFAPGDQENLMPLKTANVVTDRAAHEMSQHLLNNVFRHCWHSGMDALIPDAGSLVANVYSRTHGDLLISTGLGSSVVHSFSDGQTLYANK
jgi:hypothetical protein